MTTMGPRIPPPPHMRYVRSSRPCKAKVDMDPLLSRSVHTDRELGTVQGLRQKTGPQSHTFANGFSFARAVKLTRHYLSTAGWHV